MTVGEDETLGVRLRRLRLARGLTQQRLAEPRYTRAFVSAVESGRRAPSADAVRYLAQRLGADLDELMTGRPPGLVDELVDAVARARRSASCGAPGDADRVAAWAGELAERFGLSGLAARACRVRGEAALHRDDVAAAEGWFAAAEDRLADEPVAARVPAIARRAGCLVINGRIDEALYLAETTLDRVRSGPADPGAEARLLSIVCNALNDLGSGARALAALREMLVLAPRVEEAETRGRVYLTAMIGCRHADLLVEMERSFAAACEIFSRLGLRAELATCHWDRGFALVRVGRLGDAIPALEKGRELLADVGAPWERAGPLTELSEVYRRLGDVDRAGELADEAVRLLAGEDKPEFIAEAYRLRGLVARERGDPAVAEPDLRRAAELFESVGAVIELAATARVLGEVLLDAERIDDAAAVMRTALLATEHFA